MTCGAVNALATMAAAVALRTPRIGSRRSAAPRPRAAALRSGGRDVRLHVLAGDHPAGPGTGDRAQVDAEVLGQLAHRRLGQRHRSGTAGAARRPMSTARPALPFAARS